uniref:Uncharacterized protein n=1 Tax=Anguilla anguilla TaxID=7936 RepID=A0A0E9XTF0_ANGAN
MRSLYEIRSKLYGVS